MSSLFITGAIGVAFAEGYPSDSPDYDNYEHGQFLDAIIDDFD